MSRNRRFIVAAFLFATTAFAQTSQEKAALADALNASYSFATPTTPGSAYTVHVDGLVMTPVVDNEAAFLLDPKAGLIPQKPLFRVLSNPRTQRAIPVGEQFYLIAVDVDAHYLRFHLSSAAQYSAIDTDGATYQSFYHFAVQFPLQKGDIAMLTPSDVHHLADPVFSKSPPPVIHLGQTQQEVRGTLGDPTQEIALENKHIAIYDKIKVVFVDGKVTDIQ